MHRVGPKIASKRLSNYGMTLYIAQLIIVKMKNPTLRMTETANSQKYGRMIRISSRQMKNIILEKFSVQETLVKQRSNMARRLVVPNWTLY